MEKLTGNQIREKFLNFFRDKHNCTIEKSSSLIPDNPTVLLTTAGMLQFVPIFLGYEKPKYNPPRATTCQKCARAGGKDSDIENVGRTPRHHTFFEMLGNFSFGDYFKKDVIPWAWDFVTNYLKLDKNRLWITIYNDDDEAFEIWNKDVGISKDRIIRKGKKDNFWGPPGVTGPCGPCTEIHYDLGEEYKCSDDCSIATCECDRWVEIWNLVFMQYFQDEQGNLTPLEKKNVDTGMGLERIAMVCQNKNSTFETDLLFPILNQVSKIANVEYLSDKKKDISLRIITDHIRCSVFMISDGIIPGNEGRNYVLRMILRRALRHGRILNIELPFLSSLVDVVIDNYNTAYPELDSNREKIKEIIKEEELKFKQTLSRGEKLLNELLANNKLISGEEAFKLYDTFGFPLELTCEIAKEKGIDVDVKAFEVEMEKQKQRAREAVQKIILTDDLVYVKIEDKFGSTNFVGYESLSTFDSKILDFIKLDEKEENIYDVILDKTPFYAQSGGQSSDTGIINSGKLSLEVLSVFKVNKLFVHRVKLLSGELKKDIIVTAKVNEKRRKNLSSHHTACHLLQAALIKVLGDEVRQQGSQVDENRTRFDFSYSKPLTDEQLTKVESYINTWIKDSLDQKTIIMNIEEAKNTGAMALFDEKYEDNVRVVTIGDISKELCGGTHMKNTSELKLVKILSESAISSGVRRIELICSEFALKYLDEKAFILDKVAYNLKCLPSEVTSRLNKLLDENKNLQKHLSDLKTQVAESKIFAQLSSSKEIKDGKLSIIKVKNIEPSIIKNIYPMIIEKLSNSVLIITSQIDRDNNFIFVSVTDNYIEKGIQANNILSEILSVAEGKGGGKKNISQGSFKNLDKFNEAILNVEKNILTKLS